MENVQKPPFLVNQETGAVLLNFDPQKGMKGYFDFMVNMYLASSTIVQILTIIPNSLIKALLSSTHYIRVGHNILELNVLVVVKTVTSNLDAMVPLVLTLDEVPLRLLF